MPNPSMPSRQIPPRSKITNLIVCLILLTLIHLPVLAEEERVSEDSVSKGSYLRIIATTPSRLEEPLGDTSGSVSILTEPEIEVKNPITVPEVLRGLPGIRLQESGTIGESATLSLRGAESSQTLILLDGIRLNSPFRGGFDLGNLVMDEIAQVEIVRGAQSALYGSDAMGGVVNLRTRRSVLPHEFSITIEAGNLQTFRESLSLGGKQAWGDYSLTVSRTDSDGQFDRDNFDANTIAGEIGFHPTSHSLLEMIPRYQQDHKELALDVVPGDFSTACLTLGLTSCVEVSLDGNREIDRTFFTDIMRYRQAILPGWTLSLTGSVVQTHFQEDNPPEPDATIPWAFFEDTKSTEVVLNLQQDLEWFKEQVLTLGAEYTADQVESEITMPIIEAIVGPFSPIDQARTNAALYVQQLLKVDKQFTLQAGVRIDHNSQFGNVVNPKVSSAYEFQSTNTKLRGSWGMGFRAPTIQEQFFPIFGNQELAPEKSKSWEVGFQQGLLGERILVDAVYFWIDYDNLIQKSQASVANIGKARTRGVESLLEIYPFPAVTVKANYTYLESRDKMKGQELPFRPRHRGNIGFLFAPMVNLAINLDMHLVSSQALSAEFILLDGTLLRDRSPGYTRVDLSGTYYLFGGLLGFRETRFFTKIRNLFDRDYQDVPGFPAPGIGFSGGMMIIL